MRQKQWLDLYAEGAYVAYQSRIQNLEVLGQFAELLAKSGYFSMFRAGDVLYGRYLLSNLWATTERYLRFWNLLAGFVGKHAVSFIKCYGLSEAHPIDARCFRVFCAENNITLECAEASSLEISNQASAETDPWNGATGAYSGQGAIGKEQMVFRFGSTQSLNLDGFPIEPNSGSLLFDSGARGASCRFSIDGAQGLFASWRFRHLHVPESVLYVTLVAGKFQVKIKADHKGWWSDTKKLVRLAPIGSIYPGQALGIKDGKGWFMSDGTPLCEIPATTTDLPDGLYFEQAGRGECYVYLDRMLLVNTLRDEGLLALREGLQPFSERIQPSLRQSNILSKKKIRCAALFHPTWYLEPSLSKVTPMLNSSYQDGWQSLLAENGIDLVWIAAQESWQLDGGRLQSDSEQYLYDPIIVDISPQTKQWHDTFGHDYQSILQCRMQLVEISQAPDFVDLFLENLKAGITDAISIASDQYRVQRCLDLIDPDGFLGARLDGSFPWAVAAAKIKNLPTLSCEISFIYHEIARLHRLAGVEETADAICVWGNEHVRRLAEFGVDSPNIHATGLLALDFYKRCPAPSEISPSERDKLVKYLGLQIQTGPCVLYGGYFGGHKPNYDADEFKKAITAILAGLDQLGGGSVLIKSMLSDDPIAMRAALNGLNQERIHILEPKQPFHNSFYFSIADVVVALPTTLLAEAAVQGCRVVCMWTGTHSNWYPVSARQIELLERIVPVARTYAELVKIVSDVLTKKHFKLPEEQAFQELFGSVRLDNTRKIALILKKLVGKSDRFFGIRRMSLKLINRLLPK